MDPAFLKLITNGSGWGFLLGLLYLVMKPPGWVLEMMRERTQALRDLASGQQQVIRGQGEHDLADDNRHTALKAEFLAHQVIMRDLAKDLNDKNRHAEMNAIETVTARSLGHVTEAREYLCERIDESLFKAVKGET